MIQWILIFLLLIYLFSYLFWSKKDLYLESFRPKIKMILEKSGFPIFPYRLKVSDTNTYTLDKRIIYVVTKNKKGQLFNTDTILFVLLHEMAHILSSENHHTPLFHQIENKVYLTAKKLGLLRDNQVDKSYPCFG
jgi:hypothetical protein